MGEKGAVSRRLRSRISLGRKKKQNQKQQKGKGEGGEEGEEGQEEVCNWGETRLASCATTPTRRVSSGTQSTGETGELGGGGWVVPGVGRESLAHLSMSRGRSRSPCHVVACWYGEVTCWSPGASCWCLGLDDWL